LQDSDDRPPRRIVQISRKVTLMQDRGYSFGRRSVLPATLIGALALLMLQGCAGGTTGANGTSAANGTTNPSLLMHMGISETSYSSRQAGGRG
jgi:hypothetical protein